MRVKEILEKALTEQIVDRFRNIDGIKELYGQKDRSFRGEKNLLFRLNPIFHNDDVYAKLQAIAQEAPKNLVVQENFYEFTNMLFYGATNHLNFTNREDIIKLLRHKKFIDIIWAATTASRLNLRAVGSIEERRKNILQILNDEKAFPVPKWWDEILKEVKERKKESPG